MEVCPNRANLAVAVPPGEGWADPFQIVHLAAWCNECGNCATFCPYAGARPWRDKLTLFPDEGSFGAAGGDGFLVLDRPAGGRELRLRLGGVLHRRPLPAAAPVALPDPPEAAVDPRLTLALRLIAILGRDHRALLLPGGGP